MICVNKIFKISAVYVYTSSFNSKRQACGNCLPSGERRHNEVGQIT
jgi:hypothetical protein